MRYRGRAHHRTWRGTELIGRLTLGVVLICLVVLAAVGAFALSFNDASVWIDAPLDGSVVPVMEPVQIVGHVTDTDGIESVRLDIDGTEYAASSTGVDAGDLAIVSFEWTPETDGIHVLSLFAQRSGDGDLVGPALATITVGDGTTTTTEPTTATTTVPETTTTATTTIPETTTTPCVVPPPLLDSPADNADVATAMVDLSWSYSGCKPQGFVFHVQAASEPDFSTIAASRAVTTDSWATPALPCGDYWWRVRGLADGDDFDGPWSEIRSFILDTGACP